MIRNTTEKNFASDKKYVEAFGLSTDTKPTDVITGSVFVEVDTGKAYLFNVVSVQRGLL